MSAWNPWALKPHGTPAAYRRHIRNGQKPVRKFCPRCADAEALRHTEWREQNLDNAARRERYAAARAAGLDWRDALAARDRAQS